MDSRLRLKIAAALLLALGLSAWSAPVRHRTPRPEAEVQIKLRDLLELVPRRSAEDVRILARLKGVEERLDRIERRLEEAPEEQRIQGWRSR